MDVKRREPGIGVYYEQHMVLENGRQIVDGANWRWADTDPSRKRLLFAMDGKLYSMNFSGLNEKAKCLHDFNDMPFQRLAAPY